MRSQSQEYSGRRKSPIVSNTCAHCIPKSMRSSCKVTTRPSKSCCDSNNSLPLELLALQIQTREEANKIVQELLQFMSKFILTWPPLPLPTTQCPNLPPVLRLLQLKQWLQPPCAAPSLVSSTLKLPRTTRKEPFFCETATLSSRAWRLTRLSSFGSSTTSVMPFTPMPTLARQLPPRLLPSPSLATPPLITRTLTTCTSAPMLIRCASRPTVNPCVACAATATLFAPTRSLCPKE